MPLDILVSDSHGKPEKIVSLMLDEYDLIFEELQMQEELSFLRKVFSNYYGEREIYINELEELRSEVTRLVKLLRFSQPRVETFLSDFLALIKYALDNRKTIKFVGD